MKRQIAAALIVTAALTAATVQPTYAASPKPAGCPAGSWVGPHTTLEVATWWTTTYGDGQPETITSIDLYLQGRADLDDDGYVCYKVNAEDRLPESAQAHQDGSVHIIDARSSALPGQD